MSSAEILRLRLRCDHEAPRLAREALGGLEVAQPVRDDAVLVASELTTNAVLRSGGEAGQELELLAERVPDGLRITVRDTGGAGGQGGRESGRRPALGVVVMRRVVRGAIRPKGEWHGRSSSGAYL